MPNFYFTAWSAQDLGYGTAADVFNASIVSTIPTVPDPSNVLVNDDDIIFHDGQPDNGQVIDTGVPQTLVNDLFIDGSQAGTAGETVFIAYTMTFTNITTGQVGSIYVLTVGGSTNANFVGFVTDVDLNPGDQVQSGGPTATSVEAASLYDVLICFSKGTHVATSKGPKLVEELCAGDLIKTANNGFQPLRWVGHRHLTTVDLILQPELRPIEISSMSNALDGLTSDITVSPQHRFLVKSHHAELYFGASNVLVAAKAFLGKPGVSQDTSCTPVDYYHLLLDQHEVIYANGTMTESLHLNPYSEGGLSQESRAELQILFPELDVATKTTQTVEPCITTHEAKVLLFGAQNPD